MSMFSLVVFLMSSEVDLGPMYAGVEKTLSLADSRLGDLNMLCQDVTNADLDLSCVDPVGKTKVYEILVELAPKVGIEFPVDADVLLEVGIKRVPNETLKTMYSQVVDAYRTSATNIVLGIFGIYSGVKSELPFIGKSRDNPPEIVEALMSRELYTDLELSDVARSMAEEKLQYLVECVRDPWASLFPERNDRKLSDELFKGKLTEDEFRVKIENLRKPRFAQKSRE